MMRMIAQLHPAIAAAVPTTSAAIAPPRDSDRAARAPNAIAPARRNPASARTITDAPLCEPTVARKPLERRSARR